MKVVLNVEEAVARECGGVWRRHADLLHHMASLPLCLSPAVLLLHLVPRVTERMVSAVSRRELLHVYLMGGMEGIRRILIWKFHVDLCSSISTDLRLCNWNKEKISKSCVLSC